MSMEAIYDLAPHPATHGTMLVMLPSAKARPQDLLQWGFVRALRERSLPIDVVAVDAHLGYYLERSFSKHLTQDIIAPARASNYQRIWLMGISLGGMGALSYLREHPANVEGVVLLAPFLGARGTIAEVVRAGGLARWQPAALKPDDDEHRLWAWLQGYASGSAASPKIYLGYGADDRYAAASAMLAERLPAARVMTIAGGHDSATWICLWQRLLDQGLFTGDKKVVRKRLTVPKKLAIK